MISLHARAKIVVTGMPAHSRRALDELLEWIGHKQFERITRRAGHCSAPSAWRTELNVRVSLVNESADVPVNERTEAYSLQAHTPRPHASASGRLRCQICLIGAPSWSSSLNMGLVCCQVDDSGVAIVTTAVWGALHALRSLGMLLQASRDGDSSMDCMYIDGNG